MGRHDKNKYDFKLYYVLAWRRRANGKHIDYKINAKHM